MSAGPNLIRILAADDHPIFRQGIAGLLADQGDMSLVAEQLMATKRSSSSERIARTSPSWTCRCRK
jgi:DNA-binding NarL/FixJ family response regulator